MHLFRHALLGSVVVSETERVVFKSRFLDKITERKYNRYDNVARTQNKQVARLEQTNNDSHHSLLKMGGTNFVTFIKNNFKLISSILTPIVLLPVWLVPGTDPAKCAYVICLMAVFWYVV